MDIIRKRNERNEDEIQILQEQLNKLVEEHGSDNLLHPDVLKFSQLLDKHIAAYTSNQVK